MLRGLGFTDLPRGCLLLVLHSLRTRRKACHRSSQCEGVCTCRCCPEYYPGNTVRRGNVSLGDNASQIIVNSCLVQRYLVPFYFGGGGGEGCLGLIWHYTVGGLFPTYHCSAHRIYRSRLVWEKVLYSTSACYTTGGGTDVSHNVA